MSNIRLSAHARGEASFARHQSRESASLDWEHRSKPVSTWLPRWLSRVLFG